MESFKLSNYIPILVYHLVEPDESHYQNDSCAISISLFYKHMSFLHMHGYHCCRLIDLVDSDYARTKYNKNFVITFDDGYRCVFENAYPILEQYGFHATIFLSTDFISKMSHWEGSKGFPMLDWQQIDFLHSKGFHFGSHSCSHTNLLELSSEQVLSEITLSKVCIEEKLQKPVELFAYPFGESNSAIQEIIQRTGYRAAFGVYSGNRNRYNQWRVQCNAKDSGILFPIKITPGYFAYRIMRRWVRKHTILGKMVRAMKQKNHTRETHQ